MDRSAVRIAEYPLYFKAIGIRSESAIRVVDEYVRLALKIGEQLNEPIAAGLG